MRSVGQLLRSQREKRKLTLDSVQNVIKIHPKYIKALESDDYAAFEGKVHAKGFLKVYVEYLGLNIDEIMALWRRDYETVFEKTKEEKFFKFKSLEQDKFVITPGIIFSGIMALLIILFFGYLLYQYRTYTGNPVLEVYHPENNAIVSADIIDITGKSELDSELFVNNQKVVLMPNGNFATSVKLKEGINTISITAVNKLNKKTEDIRTVIYRPEKPVISEDIVKEATEATQSTSDIEEEIGELD